MQQFGKILIFIGLLVIIVGVIVWLFHDKMGWLGNLPGDINIRKGNTRIYIPVTTMILISIFLSFILWIIGKIFK